MDIRYKTLSLSGPWELTWLELGQGSVEAAHTFFAGDRCITCPVPGDVHMALAEAGVIREPLEDLNSLDCRWMEQQEFWYRKKFRVSEDFLQDKCEIIFEGLDTTADIWLNGCRIGSHNNAFYEKILDVTPWLKPGENVLVVRIDEGIRAVQDKPLDLMKYSWNAEQPYRAWMRKPQFVYGWDWTIWLPSCGIWKGVTLRSYHKAAINNVNIRTKFQGASITGAEKIILNTVVETEYLQTGTYTVRCRVSEDPRFGNGEVVAEGNCMASAVSPGRGTASLEIPLENPQLWWPNGSGRPYLYTVAVTVEDEEGHVLQEQKLRHGLRTVCIREDVLDEVSKSFTFTINGERIFCKGANHVPADCFPGRITDEKTRALLQAAADGNMNMIRVWGGGIYESEGFMDACDELGIMVWHDFMFACAFYPDHVPEFYEEIRREATAAIRRLRNHASLVGWSGNNEIQGMYHSIIQWHPDQQWNGGRLYEKLLPGLVAELCPDRIYRPSSPFGGMPSDCYEEGDQHTWHFTHRPDWEHYLDLWRFTDFDYKFLSEFGIIGAMNLESAKKCICEDALDPHSPQWRHHTNSNNDHNLLDLFIDKYFGLDSVRDLQDYILKSQVIQAEIMRHIYDELRSRKFRCSGVLLWTLSDSYGIHNWSVIDYYLGRRPVYYYLKRAMAPVNVAFRGYEVQSFEGMSGYRAYWHGKPQPITLVAANDALEEKQVEILWQVVTFSGDVRKAGRMECVIPPNSAQTLGEVDISDIASELVPEETVLYAWIKENGIVVNENHYFFAPYGKLGLRSAKVSCTAEKTGEDTTRLTLVSDTFVWMLHMDDPQGCCSDNDFILLPGVPKAVTLKGRSDIPGMHSLNPELTVI